MTKKKKPFTFELEKRDEAKESQDRKKKHRSHFAPAQSHQ